MGIIDGITDAIKEEISDDPEWKGYRFEKYVESLFDPKYFSLIEKTHSYRVNQERYVESSMNFDFIWKYKPTRKEFAVEAKYRSHLNKDKMLPVSRADQLQRYKDFANKREIPYFIVIGLAGYDDEPESMFCIPLNEVKFPDLYPSIFKNFERNPKSKFFWKDGVLK